MPAVIDKALDFIGAMDVSAPTPSSMNESTAKGIFKYLKELGGNDSNLLIVFYVQIMPELTRKAGTRGSRKKWLDGQKKWSLVNAL